MTEGTFSLYRTTTIVRPPHEIYPKIIDFRRWAGWSPWERLDPNLDRTYSDPSGGLGAVYAWSGNRKAGRGQMEIVGTTEPTEVQIDLRFEKPFKAHNRIVFLLQHGPDAAETMVTWSMTGKTTRMSRLIGRFISMDRLVGGDFESGLAQLKALAERA